MNKILILVVIVQSNLERYFFIYLILIIKIYHQSILYNSKLYGN